MEELFLYIALSSVLRFGKLFQDIVTFWTCGKSVLYLILALLFSYNSLATIAFGTIRNLFNKTNPTFKSESSSLEPTKLSTKNFKMLLKTLTTTYLRKSSDNREFAQLNYTELLTRDKQAVDLPSKSPTLSIVLPSISAYTRSVLRQYCSYPSEAVSLTL